MRFLQTLIDALALGALFALVAMGVSLLFGVMRLVNFAYGELITAGAYALLLTKGMSTPVRIGTTLAVTIVLAALINFVLTPFRAVPPTTALIATFALSFLLQNLAILWFGTQGSAMEFLPALNQAFAIGEVRVRWITLASLVMGVVLVAAMALILRRTDIGLQMRAAAADFSMALVLGVRGNRVILVAFLATGFLAGAVTLALAVQRPLVTPSYGFSVLVPALVGVVVGGLDRLVAGTMGGFFVGFATVMMGQYLPPDARVFLNSALFTLVIVVLLVRPNGLFVRQTKGFERL